MSMRTAAFIGGLLMALLFISLIGYSTFTFNRSFDSRELQQEKELASVRRAENIRYQISEYSKEWKNILIRGENSVVYHRHLKLFYQMERDVFAAVDLLKAELDQVDDQKTSGALEILRQDFVSLGRAYRKALHDYNSASMYPVAQADAIVQTAEQELSQRSLELVDAIVQSSAQRKQQLVFSIKYHERTIAIIVVLIVLISNIAVYIVNDRITVMPVRQAIRGLHRVAQGDFAAASMRSDSARLLELYELLRSLELMRERIKQGQEALVDAKEQAELASKAKSEFLSSMSHELRTPLNAIIGFSELLGEAAIDEEQKNYAVEINRAGNHLLYIINDILDITRIESDKLRVSLEAVDVEGVIAESVALTQPLADKKAVQLKVEVAPELFACGDYLRVKQALINLLSNAVKYSDRGGRVIVRGESVAGNKIRFTVDDNGRGIPADKLSQLFQPFERLDEDGFIEGAGIGLALTKKLVELMQGDIGVESAPGKGSRFWFQLPWSDHPVQTLEETLPAAVAIQESSQNYVSHAYTLLYIEDNPVNIALVKALMKKRPDIECLVAETGAAGLEMVYQQAPNLILLDINLPDMSGYEVIAKLKSSAAGHIPAIALSANAMPDDIKKGRQAGFDDYLVKPINSDQFFKSLERFLPRLLREGKANSDSRPEVG